jgi:hypothetical protein
MHLDIYMVSRYKVHLHVLEYTWGGGVYVSVQQPRPFSLSHFQILPPNDFGQYFSHRRVFLFIAYTLTDSFGTTVTQKLCTLYCVLHCIP